MESVKVSPGEPLFVRLIVWVSQNHCLRKRSDYIRCGHKEIVRRESEYNRGTGCEKTARPGLYGGHLVTEVPTVRGF